MVTRIKKSIDNSKRKGDFKKRQQFRIEKKQRQNNMEKHEFVDKRELLANKKKGKKTGRQTREQDNKESGDENADMEDDSEEDKELEKELAEEAEANNPEALDETIFDRFATGELDLPEVEDEDDFSEPEDAIDDDSELEAYYEELGIDADEMHDKRKKSVEDKLYKKQKKADVKKTKVETAKRERNDVITAMMEKAKKEPNYKTLTRIIQVVKAVFTEKVDTKAKKGKDEDEEMNEE